MTQTKKTSIRIRHELKQELNSLGIGKTYEDTIKELMKQHKRVQVAKEMREYGTQHAKQGQQEVKEWAHTEIH